VFSAKIKVPTWEKVAVLAHGFWMTLRIRLFRRAS
jgi:hypothetical protein